MRLRLEQETVMQTVVFTFVFFCAAPLAAVADLSQQPHIDAGAPSSELAARGQGHGSGRAVGDLVVGPFDVATPTMDPRCLGVEQAWGYYWVTGTDDPNGPKIYQFDREGLLLAIYPQTTTSVFWGQRDLCADDANHLLYAGSEGGEVAVYAFDPVTKTLAFQSQSTWGTAGTARGLARNPDTGNFFVGDFGGDIEEVDPLTGIVLFTYPNPSTVAYGMAWDRGADTLWIHGQDDDGQGNLSHLHEFRVPGGGGPLVWTGTEFWTVPPPGGSNLAGGLGFSYDSRNPDRSTLIALQQSNAPNQIAGYDTSSVPILTLSGDCPGNLSVTVRNATPFGSVAVVYGTGGSFTVPQSFPLCGGLQIDVVPASPVGFRLLPTDAFGTASALFTNVPAGACGFALQAVDVPTCVPSSRHCRWEVGPDPGEEPLLTNTNEGGYLDFHNDSSEPVEINIYDENGNLVETIVVDPKETLHEYWIPEGYSAGIVDGDPNNSIPASGTYVFST